MQEEARKGEVRQASTNEHKIMSKKGAAIYNKMEYNKWRHKCVKKEKVQDSPLANSLLPPQHHRCRRRRLVEALLGRPPLDNLSLLEEVGEPRSP